jgi:hypothetical protein
MTWEGLLERWFGVIDSFLAAQWHDNTVHGGASPVKHRREEWLWASGCSYDAFANDESDQLGVALKAERLHGAVLVKSDRPRRDLENIGNLFHWPALGQQLQNFSLSHGQMFSGPIRSRILDELQSQALG